MNRVDWLDRAAWKAMAQEDPARFSWPRALLTVGAGIVLAMIIYATFFPSITFVVGLAVAYAFLLWRAHSVHIRHLRSDSA